MKLASLPTFKGKFNLTYDNKQQVDNYLKAQDKKQISTLFSDIADIKASTEKILPEDDTVTVNLKVINKKKPFTSLGDLFKNIIGKYKKHYNALKVTITYKPGHDSRLLDIKEQVDSREFIFGKNCFAGLLVTFPNSNGPLSEAINIIREFNRLYQKPEQTNCKK